MRKTMVVAAGCLASLWGASAAPAATVSITGLGSEGSRVVFDARTEDRAVTTTVSRVLAEARVCPTAATCMDVVRAEYRISLHGFGQIVAGAGCEPFKAPGVLANSVACADMRATEWGATDNVRGVEMLLSPFADTATADATFKRPITFQGFDGDDELSGGAANDTFIGGQGGDRMTGGAGQDTVSYAGVAEEPLEVTTQDGLANDGAKLADLRRDNVTAEVVIGGQFDDRLVGDAGANRLDGRGGNDILDGGEGPDQLLGGAGRDTVTYQARTTPVRVALLAGGAADGNELDGTGDAVGPDVEDLIGGSGSDFLIGSSVTNRLFGRAGEDRIEARDGIVDLIDCGDDKDVAWTDPADQRVNCEG